MRESARVTAIERQEEAGRRRNEERWRHTERKRKGRKREVERERLN